jgi:hypothetical protein
MASPTEPPICRKNVRLDVATPSCWTGTAFWTTTVKTLNVGPIPRPRTNIQNQRDGSGVSDRSWVMRTRPAPMMTRADRSSTL